MGTGAGRTSPLESVSTQLTSSPTTPDMLLTAPDPPLFHPIPWLAWASLGNKGIPLGDGRSIPLTLDPLFLITGGFGGFGLEVARRLVSEGARHIAVLSRSGPSRPATVVS